MKKIVVLLAAGVIAFLSFYLFYRKETSREAYADFIASHPYSMEISKGAPEGEAEKQPDRPDLAFMQDFLRTMDPTLKRPTPEVLTDIRVKTARLRDMKDMDAVARTKAGSLSTETVWEERGPSVVGGRTRALLFDPADPQKKKVWAGGVSGGLWYNDDITDPNSTWIKVDDYWDNISISCISDDPNNPAILYVGTGEANNSMRGGGIWKTTDGGDTWSRLSSTINFLQIKDIEVRDENGTSVVYAAVYSDFNDETSPMENNGLYRSANGGTSWTQVLPVVEFGIPNTPTDIELGDNEIWVGTKPTYSNTTQNSTVYKSTTGTGNWTSTEFLTRGQIELAVAPSNTDVIYAILEENGAVDEVIRSTDNGDNWFILSKPLDADTGIPAEDFTRGQAWYDLTIAVHPTDPDVVLVGGIDLFKTTNGGTSWSQISKWHSGIGVTAPVVHADQHEILYRPGFGGEAIFGNDGGVYYGSNLTAGSSITISARNNNYNVTQFYSAALHPLLQNYMLGGTQDNGTQKFTLSGFGTTSEAQGGDGGMCFIDQLDPTFQIVSYIFNDISVSDDGGVTFSQLINDPGTGHFINVGEYDSHQKVLYTARDDNSLYRIRRVTTTPSSQLLVIPGLDAMATAIRVSPYTTTQSNLFVGSATGKLFKIVDAEATDPVITEITGTVFPNGSVSGIAFGENEDQILVTFSNYGVVSIWETRDGGDTWANREGDLPNMPVRWVEYHPHNPDQAYIATELGVWSTDNINVASPEWKSTNGGLANVRTDMLRIRKSDGLIMAATHGRGVFTALIPSQLEQTITFETLANKTFGDAPFTLEASSTSLLEVTFTSSNPAIASIDGNTLTILGAGTVTITAEQAGNIHFKSAGPVEQTLTINKAAQAITFDALPEKTVIDADFDLTATATSDLEVNYTSSNPSVATVSGNTVLIAGPGTTTITARQPGNSNFLAAADVARELTVVSRIINLNGELDFGEVVIGELLTRELTITNTGTASITVNDITVPAGFQMDEPTVTGSAIVVHITFMPTEEKAYTGEVEVESNATSGDNSMQISGTGILITNAELKNPGARLVVYPNPASEWLVITGENFKGITSLDVTDESGKSFNQPVESSEMEIKMKVSAFRKGTYIIAIPVGQKLIYKKFSKI